jgi:hypothetical protein
VVNIKRLGLGRFDDCHHSLSSAGDSSITERTDSSSEHRNA